MSVVFLTSHTGGYIRQGDRRVPAPLYPENGLVDNLKCRWKAGSRVLIVAADPADGEKNESLRDVFTKALPMTGLTVSCVDVLDGAHSDRNPRDYDCVILSGGHVPTQNAFFHEVGLKEKLTDFPGIIIGISAGSMNAAEEVYAHPELDGEAIDPEYRRFLPGLGLTKRQILPHYQAIRDDILDGLHVFRDIACPDSSGRGFFAIPDGTYILCENGRDTLFGEAWRIRDGEMQKISDAGSVIWLE